MTDNAAKEGLLAMNQGIVEEFRTNNGKVGGPFAGRTLLLLTTTGAKSSEPRLSPLAYFDIDGKTIIVGSYAGADISPAWVHNLRAHPAAHVDVATEPFEAIESYDVVARELPRAERDELYPKVVARSATFGEYQAKTSRTIPLFELQRA